MSLVWDCRGLAPFSSEWAGGCGPYAVRRNSCLQAARGRIRLSAPLSIFLRSEHDDSSYQVVRNGLIDRKLDRTFSLLEWRKFLLKGLHAGRDRIESNVILVRREVDQPLAVQFERRHLIADCLDGFRRGFSNRQPDSLKDALNILGEGLDVLVNRLPLLLAPVHAIRLAIEISAVQAFEVRGGAVRSVARSRSW